MKKSEPYIAIIVIVIIFIVTGCNVDERSKEKRNQVNNEVLYEKYEEIQQGQENLIIEIDGIKNQLLTLENEINEKDENTLDVEKIQKELEYMKNELHNQDKTVENVQETIKNEHSLEENIQGFTVYDPKSINSGDELKGLTVSSIDLIDNGEFVTFDGYIILTCEVMINEADGGLFIIHIDEDIIKEKIPVSTSHIDYFIDSWYGCNYCLSNDDVMTKALGEVRYQKLLDTRGKIKITAIFNNYIHAFVDGTGVRSTVSLIEILEIEESNEVE